jgi:hypothetical protein
MTPKEKARELISKMDVIHYMKLGGKNKDSRGLPISMHDDQVKQCALIAVDEVLRIPYLLKKETWFYKEVKQEIQSL